MSRDYKKNKRALLTIFLLVLVFSFQPDISAQNVSNKAALFFSPRIETVLVGSTFDVSIFLDTQGNSINVVELNLKFPPDKLAIVQSSGGKSFFTTWLETPVHSNIEGTATFVGGVPNGIITASGLVTTITFKAKTAGQAIVEISSLSKVLANDALGTNILTELDRGIFTINPKPPEGVKVFSKTHPSEDRWYNNNSPILMWEKDPGVTDFSFVLDDKPSTIPDNTPDTEDTITSFENLADGVKYFHIKAREENIWGTTTHFPLYIDTTPPLPFKPKIEILTAAVVIQRALVSFSTTDLLSGVDHYEVGVIDKTRSPLESPSFIQAQSPYQLPSLISADLRVIVRAVDRAGNVRDESVDLRVPFSTGTIFVIGFVVATLLFLTYYFRDKITPRLKKLLKLIKSQKVG